MAVPKSRHCKSRRDRRRSHLKLEVSALVACARCGKMILTHRACPACGYYKGRMVVNVLEKVEKSEKKKREKEIQIKEKETKKQENLSLKELSKKA